LKLRFSLGGKIVVAKKPTLTLVSTAATGPQPPRKLGEHGLKLWNAVQGEYRIDDIGGVEILAQVCAALDRAEALAAQIAIDGETVMTKAGLREHPGFVCRNLQRLGLNVEALKPIGRPSGWSPSRHDHEPHTD
jgi:hypothetical protein